MGLLESVFPYGLVSKVELLTIAFPGKQSPCSTVNPACFHLLSVLVALAFGKGILLGISLFHKTLFTGIFLWNGVTWVRTGPGY